MKLILQPFAFFEVSDIFAIDFESRISYKYLNDGKNNESHKTSFERLISLTF